jgi:hypothetical protein
MECLEKLGLDLRTKKGNWMLIAMTNIRRKGMLQIFVASLRTSSKQPPLGGLMQERLQRQTLAC